jgi:hypothetical protein
MPIIRHSEKEKHTHKMTELITEEVKLENWELLTVGGKAEWNNIFADYYDVITFKGCKCGYKEPLNVERRIQSSLW